MAEDGSQPPIATLHRTEGAPPGLPESVPFGAQSTVVSMGRLESNQVALNDRKISKVHCRLIVRTCKRKGTTDGEIMTRIFIKDQSTFGTFVNGKALAKEQWTMLQEDDVIGLRNPHGNPCLGEYAVKYFGGGEAGESPPAEAPKAQPAAVAAQPPAGLMAVKQEVTAAAPAAAPVAAAPPAGLMAVKQEVAAAAPPAATVAEPERLSLTAVKEELLAASAPAQHQKAQLPRPPAAAEERPLDPRQQMKAEPGQEQPPERPRARLPAPLPTPRPAAPPAAAEAAPQGEDMGMEVCSPLSEEEGGGAQPEDMAAEPLSPLSEISEVSADEGTAPPPMMMPPAFPMIPGMGTMPGMTMPGMGTMPGMAGMTGIPGLPPGMNPLAAAALLAGMRPGMPPMPPGVLALLQGGMLPGLGAIPRPPPPAGVGAPVEVTTVALPGAPAPAGLVKAKVEAAEVAKPVVINVQQELIGMLIGKGGETVKQLSKDSGARIEISKTANAEGTSSEQRCVYLSGSEEAVTKAKAMIEETLNKARENKGKSDNPNACTMRVPHELIGMLIGRGGETIKELKKESGARVDISKEATAGEDENDRLVHISGPPECVEFAKNMVEDMLSRARERVGLPVRDRSGSRSPRRASSPGRALAVQGGQSAQTTVKVAHELVGMLIGKGGETIKNISRDSGCRIEIAKDEAAEQEEKRTVYLSGPPDCIARAKDMIEDVMNGSREARAEGGGVRRGSRSRSRGGKGGRSRSRGGGRAGGRGRTVLVPQDAIGMLIGKGGETIRAISKDTGARIEINKEDTSSADRQVILSGAPEQIDKAHDEIDDILRTYRERLGRADRRSDQNDRRNRSPPRALALRNENDFNDGSDRRAQSPVKDTWLNEKIYIDEVEMPHRPNFLPEHEDGLPSDLEIFVKGLPRVCTERDLWEHLYRLGATDVKEILLLRRQKQSKGMAYVVFNRHDHAMMAKHKLSGSPASAIPCGGTMPAEEKGLVHVRFSESERCINGRNNVYNTDMVNFLLGHRGRSMQQVKDESALRKVLITGRNMKSFGQVDEDPRLHLVVYYEPDEVERVSKAIDVWGEQLGRIHCEMMEHIKGKGKGKMDMMHFPPPMMHFPPPGMPPMGMPPARPPFGGDDSAGSVESPVLLQRRKLAPAVEGEAPKMAGPKVLEATCLRGRELRWQPWPEVAQFNEDWHALPMRWGLRGELFVLLRKRETGETRVCAAEVSLPLEKWPVLNASHTGTRTAKYKSFIFNEHLFLISIDRESGTLKVFHVPDPSSPWDVAFETTLPEEADLAPEGFGASRRAKMSILYAQDRSPHVVVVEPGGAVGAQLFKIVDPAKPWVRRAEPPPLSSKARVLPVYTKTSRGTPGDYEASIFSIDGATNELSIYRVPVDTDKPWLLVAKLPFAGDTRLCCVYVPGKPEPLLMAGSPTERLQKLCHLNLIEWTASKLDDRAPPPKAPIVEEKFSRQMASLWPESRDGSDAQLVVATPIDCTADMPVSKHAWVTMPLLHVGELERAGPPGAPPGAPRPPFGRSPFEDPWGAFRPPFDPHGPPPYGMRPPFDPHGPPPPFGQPPFDKGMGKGGPPPGFDPHRPPFNPSHPGGPPPGFERPPFDAGHPPRPPFDMPPMGMPPFETPPLGRPPFDAPPGARPPFDAPPGEWFGGKGGMRPPFDAPMRPPAPGASDGQSPTGPLEAGSFVEADFREQGQFLRAKILAKHEDGTFDIEYDGDYVEWKVPQSRIRIGQPGAPPPGAPPPGAPPGGEAPKERRRHRHRHRGEGEEAGEGGERRHHRHRRRKADGEEGEKKGEDGSEGEAAGEAAGDGTAEAPKEEAEVAAAVEGEEGGENRRRHRRQKKEKDEEKDRSQSKEGEEGQKKEKKRRRRSGERGRRHKGDADGAAAGESRDAPPKQDGEDAPASPAGEP